MTKEQIFNTVKWVVIGIIALLLLKECRGIIDEVKPDKPVIKDSIVHTRDTIWAHDTTIVFKPKKVFVPIVDTMWLPSPIDTVDFYKVFVSRDTFPDSNLILYSEIRYQGLLREVKPSYKLKIPIKIIDSVKVTREIPKLYPPKYQIHGGILIGRNIIAPEVSGSINRSTFGVGYNLLDKSPTLRYSYTIFRK